MARGQKTGGRKKGTSNKRSQYAIELAKKLGVEPLEILLMYAAGDWQGLGFDSQKKAKIDNTDRISAAKDACKYLYPALRSVELKGDENGGPISVQFVKKKAKKTSKE